MTSFDLPNDMDALCILWRHAKEAEVEATERRRVIEDKMNALIGLADTSEGVTSVDCSRFLIKVTHRLTRSVDAQELQAIAAEYGLSDTIFPACSSGNRKLTCGSGSLQTHPSLHRCHQQSLSNPADPLLSSHPRSKYHGFFRRYL